MRKRNKKGALRTFIHIGIAVCFSAIAVLAILYNYGYIGGADINDDIGEVTIADNFDKPHTQEELDIHVNLFSKEKAQQDIAEARNAGAEYVFVYMHWGSQNSTEVTERQIIYGQELADAGADYILGNHPHVLNRFDFIAAEDGRSVPVIYSLGNFFTDMNEVENLNSDSMILKVDLVKDENGVRLAGNGYIPCFILIDYNGLRNLTVPCDMSVNDNNVAAQLERARERIKTALGEKISEAGYSGN